MAAELLLVPEAELDIAEAYAWYEAQRAGLGEQFITCLDACIESIRRSPESHKILFDEFRRGLVRRFPYANYFELDDAIVIVYGVFHASRDPKKWRRRLTGE